MGLSVTLTARSFPTCAQPEEQYMSVNMCVCLAKVLDGLLSDEDQTSSFPTGKKSVSEWRFLTNGNKGRESTCITTPLKVS